MSLPEFHRSGSPRRAAACVAALLLIATGVALPPRPSRAAGPDPAIAAILAPAESLFKAMKARDDRSAWALLTAVSRRTIVDETLKALAASAADNAASRTREQVAKDFAEGGPVARTYWTGFLRRFDPDEALERSRWEIGLIDAARAVVAITARDSERPAAVKMFREEGAWKVGLVETFWTR